LTTSTLTRRACAKINLTLDVFSKRPDGYHGIASVMQAIGLYDTLTLERVAVPGVRFTCSAPAPPDVPADDTNLVVRAAKAALQSAATAGKPLTDGIAIHLEKGIPSQAGLGGGSSDAAATLLAVNDLLALDLPTAVLRELAAGLGSDVSFFLIGGTATARGRGEQLTALPDIAPLWLVVVKPEESVSTGWAYNALDTIPDRQSHRGTKRLEEALRQDDRERLIAFQGNDFELPVFDHHPKLAWLHDELRMAGALTAHLCGSGSALYGVAETAPAAERIAALMRKRYDQVFVAPTLSRAQSLPEAG
jgi:4-diphosphocytidyl-2-C-methyl-D-erythritol kinase